MPTTSARRLPAAPTPSVTEAGTDTGIGPANASGRELLTIEQVSAWLQVPKQTLYKWRCTGAGPRGYRVGKHVRFAAAEVEA